MKGRSRGAERRYRDEEDAGLTGGGQVGKVGQIGGDDVGRLADLKVVLHSSAVLAYQLTVLLQYVGMVVGEEREEERERDAALRTRSICSMSRAGLMNTSQPLSSPLAVPCPFPAGCTVDLEESEVFA